MSRSLFKKKQQHTQSTTIQTLTNKTQQQIEQKNITYSQIIKKIRKLENKKHFNIKDFKQLIFIIKNSDITVFTHLKNILQCIKQNLQLGNYMMKLNQKQSIFFKQNIFDSDSVNLKSKFFNKGLLMDKNTFIQLYKTIKDKLLIFSYLNVIHVMQQNSVKFALITNLQEFMKDPKFRKQMIECHYFYFKQISDIIFPTVTQLIQTMEQCNFLKDDKSMKRYIQWNKQKKIPQIEQIASLKFKIKMFEKFCKAILNKSQLSNFLEDYRFFDLQQLIEKNTILNKMFQQKNDKNDKKNQKQSEISKKSSQITTSKEQLGILSNDSIQLISSQCINCCPFFYSNRDVLRQRCSKVPFKVFSMRIFNKSNQELRNQEIDKFKQIVQCFSNSLNEGSILFPSQQNLFGIKINETQILLGQGQSKKQALHAHMKTYFPKLQPNKDYKISIVPIKQLQFIQQTNLKQQTIISTKWKLNHYIIRLQILNRYYFKDLKQKYQKYQKQNKLNQLRVFDLHTNRKFKDQQLSVIKQKIKYQKELQLNDFKSLKLNDSKKLLILRGRQKLYQKHQYSNNCQDVATVSITSNQNESETKISSKKTKETIQFNQTTDNDEENLMISYKSTIKIIDQTKVKYKYWNLLIVDCSQKQTIQKQIKQNGLKDEDFRIKIPFEKTQLFQTKSTLLIMTKKSEDDLRDIIRSQESQKNKLFRHFSQKEHRHKQLVNIKVYQSIQLVYSRIPSLQQIKQLQSTLQFRLKQYYHKHEQLWQQDCQVYICRQNLYKTSQIFIITSQSHPSYSLLYLYRYLKNPKHWKKNQFQCKFIQQNIKINGTNSLKQIFLKIKQAKIKQKYMQKQNQQFKWEDHTRMAQQESTRQSQNLTKTSALDQVE